MDIAEWLRGLGLGQYVPAFAENAINWDVLPELTADDLKEIGVAAVGDRRRLLAAIAALRGIAAPAPPAAAVPRDVPGAAERRQLTVMFCDLVGSTPLAVRYDPEDLREIVGAYHRCVADTVARFAGFVAKYMGDETGEPADRVGDAAVIGADDLAQVLGVVARRQRRRADQIAEHHGQLAPLGLAGDHRCGSRCGRCFGSVERGDGVEQASAVAHRRDTQLA